MVFPLIKLFVSVSNDLILIQLTLTMGEFLKKEKGHSFKKKKKNYLLLCNLTHDLIMKLLSNYKVLCWQMC